MIKYICDWCRVECKPEDSELEIEKDGFNIQITVRDKGQRGAPWQSPCLCKKCTREAIKAAYNIIKEGEK